MDALPFPGFPTDLQPFASVYALNCNGRSTIRDNIYTERFTHLYEIRRMGMLYENMNTQVIINGMQKLAGTSMEGTDIRMAVALVMAALIAEGESKIYGLGHILRGYDNFVKKLLELGADVAVVGEGEVESSLLKIKM